MKWILLCIFFFVSVSLSAQSGNISGKIVDSSTQKPMALTTVTVFKANDTSIITYRLSNDAGEFKIPSLPFNVRLRLLVTYSGFDAYRKEFELSTDKPVMNFGSILMTGTSKQLDEVIVTAERPPVIFKKDTIEFNASAFKTLPTALLEDLLKKLPGVEVDENGNILVNGRPVNRILVDGKRFFGDDPKMATRNLPSDLIDKIQVTDDKDQIAENNDGDMSKIGKVINLTLKKAIKKALFGKVYAGGGTDSRYEAGGIINTFRDTLQMSFLAYSNNVNRSGFSFQDVTQLGGFGRSGFDAISIWSGGGRDGFAINGISFGGTGQGLTTSSGAGFNLNHNPSKNLSFYGQYFYGRAKNDVQQSGNTDRIFGDTVLSSGSISNTISITNSHVLKAGGNWRADSLTNMTFSAGATLSDNASVNPSTVYTSNSKLGPVTNTTGTRTINGDNNSYNYNLSLTKRFKGKRSRSLSVYNNFSYTKNPVVNIAESVNDYLYPSASTLLVQQLRSTNSPSTSLGLNLNYSEQITKNLTLRYNQRYNYNNQAQLIATYTKHSGSMFYDSLNALLSNELRREQTQWANVLTFNYKIKKITFNAGANYLEQWIHNRFQQGANNNQRYADLLFNGGFYWNRVNFSISQNVNAPSVNYLNPVTDNSNPFYIVNGDPNLRPARQTNYSLNGNISDIKHSTSYFFYANITQSKDAVAQSMIVNSNGVQITTPVNVDGVNSGYISFNASKQYKKNPKFIFSVSPRFFMNYNTTPLLYNGTVSKTTSYSTSPSVRLTFNWHDVVELNPSYTYSFRKSTYTSNQFSTTKYTSQNAGAEFIVRLPKKFVWENNLTYSYISNLAPGLPKSNLYWNAAVTLLMFKEDKGQLKLAVYDVLNRNNSVNRYISGNAIIDSRVNVLQRYFMLTYSYNIRSMGGQKQKVGGKQSFFIF